MPKISTLIGHLLTCPTHLSGEYNHASGRSHSSARAKIEKAVQRRTVISKMRQPMVKRLWRVSPWKNTTIDSFDRANTRMKSNWLAYWNFNFLLSATFAPQESYDWYLGVLREIGRRKARLMPPKTKVNSLNNGVGLYDGNCLLSCQLSSQPSSAPAISQLRRWKEYVHRLYPSSAWPPALNA